MCRLLLVPVPGSYSEDNALSSGDAGIGSYLGVNRMLEASKWGVRVSHGGSQKPVLTALPKTKKPDQPKTDPRQRRLEPLIRQGRKGKKPCSQEIPSPSNKYSTPYLSVKDTETQTQLPLELPCTQVWRAYSHLNEPSHLHPSTVCLVSP